MRDPYADLPDYAHWDRALPMAAADLAFPRHRIRPETRIVAAGSCFARHIGLRLQAAGCALLTAEAPPPGISAERALRLGYRPGWAQSGDIQTPAQLRQLIAAALNGAPADTPIWQRRGGWLDGLRPFAHPGGFASADAALAARAEHLRRLGAVLRGAEVAILTLGQTECWESDGQALPLHPASIGATALQPPRFRRMGFAEILADLTAIMALLQRARPGMRMILTLSPVMIAATAGGGHVLPAAMAAKATLRAAVAEFTAAEPLADYFPSYEIVTHPALGGPYLTPDLRRVTVAGVDLAMAAFLAAHGLTGPAPSPELVEGDCDRILDLA